MTQYRAVGKQILQRHGTGWKHFADAADIVSADIIVTALNPVRDVEVEDIPLDPGRRCQAYQASDTMYCARCKLQWDVNDPEPPPCRRNSTGDAI